MKVPESNSNAEVRAALRSLPARVPPPELTTRLRVQGSREAARRRKAMRPWQWLEDMSHWMSNLMRPFAIPTAGGFAAAVLLFTALAPTLVVRAANSAEDVPTMLYTDPTLRSYVPIAYDGEEDIMVELTVDDQGRLIDWTVTGANSPATLRSIQSQLLTIHFYPAKSFGQPTNGRVRFWLRNSRIDVKG